MSVAIGLKASPLVGDAAFSLSGGQAAALHGGARDASAPHKILSAADDATRTRFLEAEGYRVLRFWNNEVLDNAEGVVARICGFLDERRV